MSDEWDEKNPAAHPLGNHVVQLLLTTQIRVDGKALLAALKERCGAAIQMLDEEEGMLMFAHLNYMLTYGEDRWPVLTVVGAVSHPTPLPAAEWEADLVHTYDWNRETAHAVIEKHRSLLVLTDMMAGVLRPDQRLNLFHNTVLALLDVVGENCVALRWVRSRRLAPPSVYRSSKQQGNYDALYPTVNVRKFRVTDGASEGETVMDTLGMNALALPDLQIHFKGLNADGVGQYLTGAAHYFFENGDIEDDSTFNGGVEGTRWIGQHEMSLVEPEREVFDINPGSPYAVGDS